MTEKKEFLVLKYIFMQCHIVKISVMLPSAPKLEAIQYIM